MKALRKVLVALAALAAVTACASRGSAPIATYGSAATIASTPLPLDRALSPENAGRTLAVKGRVAEVCKMKGCWMVLTDDRNTVRITFKDYAFFVPRDLAGKTVVAEGILSKKVLTEEEAEHLAAESSAPAPPGRVSREEWALVASSVVVPSAP
jgi:Domain of unknown function (DUF4920)